MVVGSEGKQCRDQPERQPCGFSLIDKVCDDVGPVLAVVRSSIEGERRHHDTVWTLWASGHSITHAASYASTLSHPALSPPTNRQNTKHVTHAMQILSLNFSFARCAQRPVAHLT